MELIKLSAQTRQASGKGAARQLRMAGFVPAVIYSSGKQAEMLKVAEADMRKVLRTAVGSVAFLSLSVDDAEPRTAMLQELQMDHLGNKLVHADFYEVRADQVLTLDVPVNIIGTPAGLDEGGILEIIARTVPVAGNPVQVPDEINLDVSAMKVGDTMTFADITLPEGVKPAGDLDMPLAVCALPAKPAVEGEEEGAEGEEAEDSGEEKE